MTIDKPNRHYQDAIRDLCLLSPVINKEEIEKDFLGFIADKHSEELQRLQILEATNASDDEVSGTKNGLFIWAVGLVAFGDKSVVREIVRFIPASGHVRRLASILNELFPLPKSMDPWEHSNDILKWLDDYEDSIEWNNKLGKYELITHDK